MCTKLMLVKTQKSLIYPSDTEVLEVVQERSRVSPAKSRSSAPFPEIFFLIFDLKMVSFSCILGGILCDLELQESKQETWYRPGKSKAAGAPAFKPCNTYNSVDPFC